MKTSYLLLGLTLLTTPILADEARDLSHEYNRIFADFLRTKVTHFKKHSFVEIFLKDRTSVRGEYLGYQGYEDIIWIVPEGKRGLFPADAYYINELQDIRLASTLGPV